MSDLIWLPEAQMRRIEPYFPLSHGVPMGIVAACAPLLAIPGDYGERCKLPVGYRPKADISQRLFQTKAETKPALLPGLEAAFVNPPPLP